MYGGNSRTNASMTILPNNVSIPNGDVVTIDASMGAIVVVRARDYRLS